MYCYIHRRSHIGFCYCMCFGHHRCPFLPTIGSHYSRCVHHRYRHIAFFLTLCMLRSSSVPLLYCRGSGGAFAVAVGGSDVVLVFCSFLLLSMSLAAFSLGGPCGNRSFRILRNFSIVSGLISRNKRNAAPGIKYSLALVPTMRHMQC